MGSKSDVSAFFRLRFRNGLGTKPAGVLPFRMRVPNTKGLEYPRNLSSVTKPLFRPSAPNFAVSSVRGRRHGRQPFNLLTSQSVMQMSDPSGSPHQHILHDLPTCHLQPSADRPHGDSCNSVASLSSKST